MAERTEEPRTRVVEGGDSVTRILGERWETIAPHASAIERDPDATVRPGDWGSSDAERVLGRLDALGSVELGAGGLELGETLGEGGMGWVRVGTQTSLGRQVAVKSLLPERQDADAVLRLLREAWVTGAVEHPNVVPVHDVRRDETGRPVIVLKRIEGEVWRDLLRDPARLAVAAGGDDPLEWNLRILIQVSRAAEFAHSRGFVHRDIKPENVMIGRFGEVYVLDWGIAVGLRPDAQGRVPLARDADALAGTPAYMAPEMLGGMADRLSERTDVYLLGAVLHEVLAARPPHQGGSLAEIVRSVVRSEVRLPEGVAPELEAICRRALSADPADRHASATHFRGELETFLRHRTSAELAKVAESSLERLLHALGGGGDAGGSRASIHSLFGECRFGFQRALATWPENPEARAGLEQALGAMVAFELKEGNARSAAVLLEEMREPPPALRGRVEASLHAEAVERERLEQLTRLEQDLDPSLGQRARTLFAVSLGVVWVASPLIGVWRVNFQGGAQRPIELLLVPVGSLVLVALLGWFGREALRRTAINRRLFGAFAFVLVANFILHAGLLLLGLPTATIQVVDFFLWFCVAVGCAAFVEPRLAIAAVGYLVSFFVAAVRPEFRYVAMFLANLLTTLTFAFAWVARGRGTGRGSGD